MKWRERLESTAELEALPGLAGISKHGDFSALVFFHTLSNHHLINLLETAVLLHAFSELMLEDRNWSGIKAGIWIWVLFSPRAMALAARRNKLHPLQQALNQYCDPSEHDNVLTRTAIELSRYYTIEEGSIRCDDTKTQDKMAS